MTISSAGKTFSFTGWKVGWVTGPADLVATVMSAKQWLTFSNAAPLQPAVAHALDHEEGFLRQPAPGPPGQARPALRGAGRSSTSTCYRPRRTYFVTTDVRRYGFADGLAFCLALPERAGVVAIPSQVFYDDQDDGPAPGALGVLQGGRRYRGGPAPAARGRPPGSPDLTLAGLPGLVGLLRSGSLRLLRAAGAADGC